MCLQCGRRLNCHSWMFERIQFWVWIFFQMLFNSYHTCMISQIYHNTCFTQFLESLILFSISERWVSWKLSEESVMTFLFEGSLSGGVCHGRLSGGECHHMTLLFTLSSLALVRTSGRAAATGLKPLRLPRTPNYFSWGGGNVCDTWLDYRSLGRSRD